MRRQDRASVARCSAAAAVAAMAVVACAADQRPSGPDKSAPDVRAARRAYDGAPPVIAHPPLGAGCASCHNEHGIEVPDLGFAPPSPHELVGARSTIGRCQQCHVFKTTDDAFTGSEFVGIPQDLRRGDRLYPGAPPVIPHSLLLRDNCVACHSGPAAREPIRTSHANRPHCRQCHAPAVTSAVFPAAAPN